MTLTAALLIIASAVGLFLTILLYFNRNPESRVLAAFTALLTAISILQLSVALKLWLMLVLPFVVFPALFLQGLIIDAYTRILLRAQRYSRQQLAVFSFPAITAFFLQISVFVFFSEFRDIEQVSAQQGIVKIYTAALFVAALGYNLAFIGIAAKRLISASKVEIAGQAEEGHGKRSWLKLFLGFNTVLCMAGLANVFYNLVAQVPAPVNPWTAILFSGGNYLILGFLIKKPAVFSMAADVSFRKTKSKYSKIPTLDAATRRQHVQKIQAYLQTEEPYLNDAFSLNDLSGHVGIAPHLISMVINTELQQNFFTLVNFYRVQKAKTLLQNEPAFTVLEIAYASGFQSKSAFNRVFKEFTGHTPSAFRNP